MSAILHLTTERRWEGQWVGPPWVDEWEGHVYMHIAWGKRKRRDHTKTEDITHVVLTKYVLLRGEIVAMAANGQ